MKADYVHKDTLTATDYVELNKNNELLISYNQALLKENQTLKEELEDMTLCRDIASGHRQEVQDRETLLLRYQERFIKYLQEEINVEIQNESVNCEITNKRYILEEILQKYKSIIGVK